QSDEADRLYERAIRTLADAPKALADRPEYRYELARALFTAGQRDQLAGPGGPDPPPRRGAPGRGPPEFRKGPPPPERGPRGGRRAGPASRPAGDRPLHRAAALLEQLVREFPAVPEYRHLLACCYRDMPAGPFGERLQAKANADRAIELLRQLVKGFPGVP